MNGIDTTALADFAAAVAADPKAGEARFTVTTHWQGASRSRAHVSSYHLGGQEHPRQFVIDADEPPGLLGDDTAPNPQELLLAGLNACMTAGIVATTAARGIALTSLRIRTSGQLDLRGYLGLDPDVQPGDRRRPARRHHPCRPALPELQQLPPRDQRGTGHHHRHPGVTRPGVTGHSSNR